MLKLLVTGALIYFVYRFFIAPPAIGNDMSDNDQQYNQSKQSQQNSHDDEYIDYEEVD